MYLTLQCINEMPNVNANKNTFVTAALIAKSFEGGMFKDVHLEITPEPGVGVVSIRHYAHTEGPKHSAIVLLGGLKSGTNYVYIIEFKVVGQFKTGRRRIAEAKAKYTFATDEADRPNCVAATYFICEFVEPHEVHGIPTPLFRNTVR